LERATPAEREYLYAMAELADLNGAPDEAVPTAQVAEHLGRKASSLSPARDSLLKKGLVYATERGFVAFTVPHFGRFLAGKAA
jgi:Mn-dependent DtxR family transcriptional regulator